MRTSIEHIENDRAPKAAGHYAQGTAWQDPVFISGQLAGRPDGSDSFREPFEVQVQQALANLLAVLSEACVAPDRVLRETAYIVGVQNWQAFDRIYAEVFGAAKPARTVVPVPELHRGCLIEVEAVGIRACSEEL